MIGLKAHCPWKVPNGKHKDIQQKEYQISHNGAQFQGLPVPQSKKQEINEHIFDALKNSTPTGLKYCSLLIAKIFVSIDFADLFLVLR